MYYLCGVKKITMQVLVTGNAGFIGYHLSRRLAEEGIEVYGIDSMNDYYDVALKRARLQDSGISAGEYGREYRSARYAAYRFRQIDLCDREALDALFRENRFDCVVNLAAQVGVRYSLTHPETYVQSNIVGFLNLLEQCRHGGCKRLIYASSSSVYGDTQEAPFREETAVDHPVSLYAATKKSNELMAYTYSRLYGIQSIGLRFFTVYGPWGRPDMAPMLFAQAIRMGEPIRIFNHGHLARDFTYIDDIVDGIVRIIKRQEIVREETAGVPATLYNIGHGSPVQLMDFIRLLEQNLGKEAVKEFTDMQPGDVHRTWADTTRMEQDYGYTPSTSLEQGIEQFIEWFKTYNQ